ncbi:hypothetical protein [Olsenella sp. oral taxon 807]|uniref:hypothetical protein n=1 Tax=Olsenella sp. oral taxon 807 TaxID=712411 RepID=UPI00155D9B96|nr:hypothetical protein [Olsenella sp. oral taxon 807]
MDQDSHRSPMRASTSRYPAISCSLRFFGRAWFATISQALLRRRDALYLVRRVGTLNFRELAERFEHARSCLEVEYLLALVLVQRGQRLHDLGIIQNL